MLTLKQRQAKANKVVVLLRKGVPKMQICRQLHMGHSVVDRIALGIIPPGCETVDGYKSLEQPARCLTCRFMAKQLHTETNQCRVCMTKEEKEPCRK